MQNIKCARESGVTSTMHVGNGSKYGTTPGRRVSGTADRWGRTNRRIQKVNIGTEIVVALLRHLAEVRLQRHLAVASGAPRHPRTESRRRSRCFRDSFRRYFPSRAYDTASLISTGESDLVVAAATCRIDSTFFGDPSASAPFSLMRNSAYCSCWLSVDQKGGERSVPHQQ